MTRITLRATGSAAASVVWARYAQPSQWASWSPQIRRVDCSATRIAAGVHGTVHSWVGPGVHFVIESVDEQVHTWTWRVSVGPIRLALDHAVTAVAGGATTSLTIGGPWPVVAAYAPLARLALQRLVST